MLSLELLTGLPTSWPGWIYELNQILFFNCVLCPDSSTSFWPPIHHGYYLLLLLGVVKAVLYITVITFCFGWVWSSLYYTSQLLPSALVGCGQACIVHHSYCLLLWLGVVKPVLYITVIAFCFGWVWSSLYYTSQLLPSALVGCGQACIVHHSYCLLLWWVWSSLYYTLQLLPSALVGVVKPVLYITVITFCFGWVWSSLYYTSQLLPSALVGCGQACIIHHSYCLLLWLGVVKPVIYITVIAGCFDWVWSSL